MHHVLKCDNKLSFWFAVGCFALIKQQAPFKGMCPFEKEVS